MKYFVGKILGDNGYACKRYLLTPVIYPTHRAEQNYNRAHKATRNIIERAFGVWKGRFPCLKRPLNTNLDTSVSIICALSVLHNIAIIHGDYFEPDPIDAIHNLNNNEYIVDNVNADALHYRRAFIVRYFGNN